MKRQISRRNYLAKREQRLEAARRRRKENGEAVKESQRRSYRARRDYYIRKAMEWRDANPERSAIHRTTERRRNRARYRAMEAARRAAMPTSPDAIAYVGTLLNDPCAYCGAPGGEIDHITPVAAGGDGDWPNLTSACRSCNASKNARSLLGHLARSIGN